MDSQKVKKKIFGGKKRENLKAGFEDRIFFLGKI